MVQIIENWSDLRGKIVSVAPTPDLAALTTVELEVTSVDSVEGFSNLLSDAAGQRVSVLVPNQLVEEHSVSAGRQVRCRVRRAGLNRIFANPDQFERL